MNKNEYKEKLKQFNSTPKYKMEVDFLLRLMQPQEKEKILDYGCGLGNLVHKIRGQFKAECYGYDVNNYRENDDEFLFRNSYYFKFDKVYFMHSIAHIPGLEQKLVDLKELLNVGSKIYVITPNKMFLENNRNPNYKPDPTVVRHDSLYGWEKTFDLTGYKILNTGQFGSTDINHDGAQFNERLFLECIWNGD